MYINLNFFYNFIYLNKIVKLRNGVIIKIYKFIECNFGIINYLGN